MHHKIYLSIVGTVFLAGVIILNTFPRSRFSELEKRELTRFPEWSITKVADGSFTREVSAWFSDSEPFRDELMTLSMKIKDLTRLSLFGENVSFVASDDMQSPGGNNGSAGPDEFNASNDGVAKIANAGIIIVGEGKNVRALMAYGGVGGGKPFANTLNRLHHILGDGVTVYGMVIPNAAEYYLPEKMKDRSKSQLTLINNVNDNLDPAVKAVNIYNTLKSHVNEDIFLRTDHHWTPLGGYYAAKEFARVAGVPFRDLDSYDKHVVHGYVGSMYGYSKDISLKENPEDFVYYTPKDIEYETYYIVYGVNDEYKITDASKRHSGPFFYKINGNGAYTTFMGGDSRLTHVKTSTGNKRRLLIVKDSFGNTLPGYLFYSFEEIHVVDNRYFHLNLRKYIRDHQITDLLIAASSFNVYSNGIGANTMNLLNQDPAKAFAPKKEKEEDKKDADEKEKKEEDKKDSLEQSEKTPKEDSPQNPAPVAQPPTSAPTPQPEPGQAKGEE